MFLLHSRLAARRRVVCVALVATACVATASAQPADPLNPRAAVPAAIYASPLTEYRRMGNDQVVSWKEANATVARVGGWRAYAREAQQAPGAATQAPTPASAPVSLPPASAPVSLPPASAAVPTRPAPATPGAHPGLHRH